MDWKLIGSYALGSIAFIAVIEAYYQLRCKKTLKTKPAETPQTKETEEKADA